jgi:CoA:oxalate CoA-transferase
MPASELRPTKGSFSGLTVVDLSHVLAGPFGTTILCDLGARIIKAEPPGHGDDTRTYGLFVKGQSLYFSFVNRGKESINLNLKEVADRQIFFNTVRDERRVEQASTLHFMTQSFNRLSAASCQKITLSTLK